MAAMWALGSSAATGFHDSAPCTPASRAVNLGFHPTQRPKPLRSSCSAGCLGFPSQKRCGSVSQHLQPRSQVAPLRATGGADGSGGRGRHPELLRVGRHGGDSGGGASQQPATTAAAMVSEQPRPEEVDERYRRADYSDVFQFESRQAFARCIAGGEPRMRLAEAALHVTAEDDAIASHSTVPFPVAAWVDRIDRLVDQLCTVNLRRAAAASAPPPLPYSPGTAADGAAVAVEAAGVLRVTERFLFEEVGFCIPDYGRSNLPANSLVDHAGIWEDARLGYLHETLIRRLGHPASLGLLLGEVATRLLARGALPCAAAIDTRSFRMLPRAVPLPQLTRDVLLGSREGERGAGAGAGGGDGTARNLVGLNTCTSEVLVEMLRHLKRSYWPFAWDSGVDAVYPEAVGSHGGFRSAAKAAIGDDMSAALAAIGKVAAWRLERGIWTSPGAGDIRRARAASERLVLLAGERCLEERRDLAVLLLHCGDLGTARLEFRTYLRAVADASSSGPSPRPPAGVGGRVEKGEGPDPFDLALCRRLLSLLEGLGSGPGLEPGSGSALEEPAEPLGVEATLQAVPPWQRAGAPSKRHLPLTW